MSTPDARTAEQRVEEIRRLVAKNHAEGFWTSRVTVWDAQFLLSQLDAQAGRIRELEQERNKLRVLHSQAQANRDWWKAQAEVHMEELGAAHLALDELGVEPLASSCDEADEESAIEIPRLPERIRAAIDAARTQEGT